jgi:hypothetical protein
MLTPSHLHFRAMSPEAQQAALQRLAWRGCDPATISAWTGMPELEIRRLVESHTPAGPDRAAPGPRNWRARGTGASRNSVS